MTVIAARLARGVRRVLASLWIGAAGTAALLPVTQPALAQTLHWPTRPISLVLPFPAGSGLDSVARIVIDKLSPALGQPILIENKPGANGALAATYVARAQPDGHTIFMTTNSTHSAAPGLYKNLAYDPIRDFVPVARMGNLPFMLVVNPNVPAKNVAEFIAYAKSRPGKLNYASTNATGLVGMATIARLAGLDMVHVPYKAAPQALTDLMAGDIQVMLVDIASGLPQMRAGRVRALAVTTRERSALLPDLPGTREAGLPAFDVNSWNGIFAPANTPIAIVRVLNAELRKIVADPASRAKLAGIGFDAFSGPPEEFDAFVKSELAQWTQWIKDAGIQPE
jgi:tripartite-type tricarboxylate transporter receptor subunit TctC